MFVKPDRSGLDLILDSCPPEEADGKFKIEHGLAVFGFLWYYEWRRRAERPLFRGFRL